jgi:hypothetical protein
MAGRLRDVPLPGITRLLPVAGEKDGTLWWLRFADGAQGPYRSRREALDDWHASTRAGKAGDRAVSEAPNAVPRRGDLVIVYMRWRDRAYGGRSELWLGKVTRTDGETIRRYRPAGRFAWEHTPEGWPFLGSALPDAGFESAAVMSKHQVDVRGRPRHGRLPHPGARRRVARRVRTSTPTIASPNWRTRCARTCSGTPAGNGSAPRPATGKPP